MKPLREQFDPTDPNEACAAALLALVPPLEPSVARQHRVRFALRRHSAARTAMRLSPALAGAMIALGATGASAMVARYWVRAHLHAAELSAAPAETIDGSPRSTAPRAKRVAPTADPPAVELVETPPAPKAADLSPKSEPAAPSRTAKSHAPAPAAAAIAPSIPGASLMIEAMQARRAGDMARAASLLSEYRTKYPDGALQEEALALSIEAAVARGDDGASRLASQYLQRYPNGRFREQAERALKSGSR